MTFRAADDYRFAQHLEKLKKSRPQYFPKEPPKQVDKLIEYEFTCYKKKELSLTDSTGTSRGTADKMSETGLFQPPGKEGF